jgi:YesN/AraC family two-component response regulator
MDLRNLLKTALSARGHEVHTFADPTEVPFFHGKDCPCKPEDACSDVLLADIVMPKVKGVELIKELKAGGCWPLSIGNVAIMSGHLTLHYMNELHELGIHYFRKPFKLDDICAWVDQCEENLPT